MNENGLTSYRAINPDNLDRNNYANSLSAEAERIGLVTESDVERLKMDMMNTLADVIGLYTKNESTSLKSHTAEQLAASMMYSIDTYLLSLGDPMEAAKTLFERKPLELYGKGTLINQKHHDDAKHLFGKARFTRLKDAGEQYDKTLDKYFPYYLRHYNAKFTAHDKIYINLKLGKYKLSGAYHIDGAVKLLKMIVLLNAGSNSDVVIRLPEEQSGGAEESEQRS
ncbi:MAG: hypothetical protein IJY35_10565 [Clostridia bacterium]|nr:hypothetical protein [Clostridia bacterium]